MLDDGVRRSDTAFMITDRVNISEYESSGEDLPAGEPYLEAPAPSEAAVQGSCCENNPPAGGSRVLTDWTDRQSSVASACRRGACRHGAYR